MEDYVWSKVKVWVSAVEKLAMVALSQPHAACSAFTHGLQRK